MGENIAWIRLGVPRKQTRLLPRNQRMETSIAYKSSISARETNFQGTEWACPTLLCIFRTITNPFGD